MGRTLTTALAVALGAGMLTSCTGDEPSDTASPSSTASATQGTAGTDQSATVLQAKLPEVQGSSQGTVDEYPATLNVAEVTNGTGLTRLTFWFSGTDEQLSDLGERAWESQPTLVDVPAKKVYEPLTFTKTNGEVACLCTDAAYIKGEPQPRTILYPALPDSTTNIQIRLKGFKPITVPVKS